jgi:hypothetical protein
MDNTFSITSTSDRNGNISFYKNSYDIAIDPLFLSAESRYEIVIDGEVYEDQELKVFSIEDTDYSAYGFGNGYLYGANKSNEDSNISRYEYGDDTGESWCVYFEKNEVARLHYLNTNYSNNSTAQVKINGVVEEEIYLTESSEVYLSQSGKGEFGIEDNSSCYHFGNLAMVELEIDGKTFIGKTYSQYVASLNTMMSWIGNITLSDVEGASTSFADNGEKFCIVYTGTSYGAKNLRLYLPNFDFGTYTLSLKALGF